MNIARRSFLAFLIGGAAGTALTPLPWKLTDDISIWTQTWPWTPVPPDGEYTYVNSVCTLCPGGCGISVRKVDNRAVKIEGMAGHPVNDGGICILGASGLQLLYGPRRVEGPLRRIGERGEGKWEKISWDAAIAMAAEKLGQIRSGGNPQGVACMVGERYGTVPSLFHRFMTAYGSPNFMPDATIEDSYRLTLNLMHGKDAIPGFDVEHADFIVSFGSGIIEGWGSPVRMFRAHSKWKDENKTLVQIEPRLSKTAAKANKWVAINPGTEAVLALSMAHVIIKESLYDKAFVEENAATFEDWQDEEGKTYPGFKTFVLKGFSPAAAAKITGVSPSLTTSLARSFAAAEKPLALCGRGKGHIPGSLHEFLAVHALNGLVGNINKEGGVSAIDVPDYVTWPRPGLDETARAGLDHARVDGADSETYPYTASIISQFAKGVNEGTGGYGVDALLVSGANPCHTLRDVESVKRAFDRIGFIVSFSSYMDETASQADLILPNHTYLERYQDVPAPFGLNKPVIGMSRPVVALQHNTRHVGDALMGIAAKMGGSVADAFRWDSYEACLEETLGAAWEPLKENGVLIKDDYSPEDWGEAFSTPTRKFQFFAGSYRHGGDTDIMSQMAVEGETADFPLTLIPYDSMRIASGPVADTPFMAKTIEADVLINDDVCVEINPTTAADLNLREGKAAVLTTPVGEARVRVHLSEGVGEGLIAMPTGLGHTANSNYIADKGININRLIAPRPDPVSGLDAAWSIRAKLARA
jgi:anaerobic selenocysteine-containing dehydrogenase